MFCIVGIQWFKNTDCSILLQSVFLCIKSRNQVWCWNSLPGGRWSCQASAIVRSHDGIWFLKDGRRHNLHLPRSQLESGCGRIDNQWFQERLPCRPALWSRCFCSHNYNRNISLRDADTIPEVTSRLYLWKEFVSVSDCESLRVILIFVSSCSDPTGAKFAALPYLRQCPFIWNLCAAADPGKEGQLDRVLIVVDFSMRPFSSITMEAHSCNKNQEKDSLFHRDRF